MKKVLLNFLGVIFLMMLFSSCSENYSNGERIGLVTQFSKRGMVWKTWEGHLNITQTGLNSADGFDFSLDGDKENKEIASLLDSAASIGWKVKLIYHQTYGKNWFGNRGETSHFIDSVIVIDKNFSLHQNSSNGNNISNTGGKSIDTIYIVITPDNPNYKKFFK
jgi:hypothetical protein